MKCYKELVVPSKHLKTNLEYKKYLSMRFKVIGRYKNKRI